MTVMSRVSRAAVIGSGLLGSKPRGPAQRRLDVRRPLYRT
jgi:hypothetical protein